MSGVVFNAAQAFPLFLLAFCAFLLSRSNSLTSLKIERLQASRSTAISNLHRVNMTCCERLLKTLCSVSSGLLSFCGQWIVHHTGQSLVNDGPPFWKHILPIGASTSIA